MLAKAILLAVFLDASEAQSRKILVRFARDRLKTRVNFLGGLELPSVCVESLIALAAGRAETCQRSDGGEDLSEGVVGV